MKNRNDRIDELWKILVDSIPDLSGKNICIPITGGLDSRILAGIVRSLGYPIHFAYWIRTIDNRDNILHVGRICGRLGININDSALIDVTQLPRDTKLAVSLLKNRIDPQEYSIVLPIHMDIFAGILKSKSKERDYFTRQSPRTMSDLQPYYSFKEIILPFETTRVAGYMLSLPRRDRLFENLYMSMIARYLPELSKIPRCFEKGTGKPVRIDSPFRYIVSRIIDKIRK